MNVAGVQTAYDLQRTGSEESTHVFHYRISCFAAVNRDKFYRSPEHTSGLIDFFSGEDATGEGRGTRKSEGPRTRDHETYA